LWESFFERKVEKIFIMQIVWTDALRLTEKSGYAKQIMSFVGLNMTSHGIRMTRSDSDDCSSSRQASSRL
jgi:hypothetical protein